MSAWLSLLANPSTYLLSVSLITTWVAKLICAADILDFSLPLVFFTTGATDLIVYMFFALLMSALEALKYMLRWLTIPWSGLLFCLGMANASYLIIAGEQGSWSAIEDLSERYREAWMVLEEDFETLHGLIFVVGLILLTAIPWAMRRGLARASALGQLSAKVRIKSSIILVAVGCAWLLFRPAAESLEAKKLQQNAIVTVVRTAMASFQQGNFSEWGDGKLADSQEVDRLKLSKQRPNIFIVVLESTRFDFTSLAGTDAKAKTPVLASLAGQGMEAIQARAVLPHTTKSLFSLLCGRLPTMQRKIIEVSADQHPQCLPKILADAGYDTAFFQSAFGTFENRPRLVNAFGYNHFAAWEDIGGEKLGYLGSDDRSLVQPVAQWIDGRSDKSSPFFITALTSMTHHPYRLTDDMVQHSMANQQPIHSAEDRYARLVEFADIMLGNLLSELDRRDLRKNTLILVVGDHGEGFGDHGIKQHDNNFYEEGLRVPLVLTGPNVLVGKINENVSLVDVTPTLLGRLGLGGTMSNKLDGHDFLASDFPTDLPRWFGCFTPSRCQGFVKGPNKVVQIPSTDEVWYFDLNADPLEQNALPLSPELETWIKPLNAKMDDYRSRRLDIQYGKMMRFPPWQCVKNKSRCKHPRAYKTKYRYSLTPPNKDDSEVEERGEKRPNAIQNRAKEQSTNKPPDRAKSETHDRTEEGLSDPAEAISPKPNPQKHVLPIQDEGRMQLR